MSTGQQLRLTLMLSVPAVLAQLSSIVMQYIDAAMVGSLGAGPSASIGLVSTSTWLFSGICSAVAIGFSVQVAHAIGAGDMTNARAVLRQAILSVSVFGLLWGAAGVSVSGALPHWLGGDESICHDSSGYFRIYSAFLPVFQIYVLSSGMLRCSGNMRIPSMMSVLMCLLDVVFNFFLIFPEAVVAVILMRYLFSRSGDLRLKGERGRFIPTAETLRKAVRIGLPMAIEHAVICGAQIMTTVIVAPLGIFAIAANSFAVTAESLCYMPGYGIADAATTLVGQSYGAGRKDLTRQFARITVLMGMAVMGVMGVVMYFGAPFMMGTMTDVPQVIELGVKALRIEAFAEPMFAASIVAYSVFVGMGNTVAPSLMNFISIWAVRLSLAWLLAPSMGLAGVWTAMCAELCFRGLIFLLGLRIVFRKKH